VSCRHHCRCHNGATCDHVGGACICAAGWRGMSCDRPCPRGYYGVECRLTCHCNSRRYQCHPVTGRCVCPSGFSGQNCTDTCRPGTWGHDCNQVMAKLGYFSNCCCDTVIYCSIWHAFSHDRFSIFLYCSYDAHRCPLSNLTSALYIILMMMMMMMMMMFCLKIISSPLMCDCDTSTDGQPLQNLVISDKISIHFASYFKLLVYFPVEICTFS